MDDFNRYRIKELLGEGGSGKVYRAYQPSLDRHVAIKVLKRGLQDDPGFREHFEREARTVAALNHKNIIPIYDYGESPEGNYIAMKYVSGGDLREWFEGEHTFEEILNVAEQMAEALDYAHEQNLVHLDIKPSNILVDRDDWIQIVDFGIAAIFKGGAAPGGPLGTPEYMSPEQIQEQEPDRRSDIYSLGVVLYGALCGRPPFEGDSGVSTMFAQVYELPPKPRNINKDIPKAVEDVLMKALEKRPENRFGSAGELAAALRRAGGYETKEAIEAGASRESRSVLPEFPSLFRGRSDQLEEIKKNITKKGCRFLTILGPGGSGKTRLAVKAAEQLDDNFRDGVYFIPLGDAASAENIPALIAEAYDFRFSGGGDTEDQLVRYLKNRSSLLVMDGFERLPEGAAAASMILKNCPGMAIIATSRERLKLKWEWIFDIEGLSYPDTVDDGFSDYPAVKLFIENARRMRRDYSPGKEERESLMKLCALMEGNPLGIELAASMIRDYGIEEIYGKVRENMDFLVSEDVDSREEHRSLRALFEQSWELLDDEQKRSLMKLSVFRGGFTLDALEKTAGLTTSDADDFIHRSFLKMPAPGRYAVHEVIRTYMEEKLEEDRERSGRVHEKHARYFGEFLKSRERLLKKEGLEWAVKEIDRDIHNIRKAWDRALDGLPGAIADSLNGFCIYLDIRGLFAEGLKKLLAAYKSFNKNEGSTAANILVKMGMFYHRLGVFDKAERVLKRSLALTRELGDTSGEASALSYLATGAFLTGRLDEAGDYQKKGLKLFASVEDTSGIANAQANLGNIFYMKGDFDQAGLRYENALSLFRETGEQTGILNTLINLGGIMFQKGNYERAKELFEEGLERSESLGDRRRSATLYDRLGQLFRILQEYETAGEYHRKSMEIHRDLGSRMGTAASLNSMGQVARYRGDYREAEKLYKAAVEILKDIRYKKGAASTLVNLGCVCLAVEEHEKAESHLREALDTALQANAVPETAESLLELARYESLTGDKKKALRMLFVLKESKTLTGELNRQCAELLASLGGEAAEQEKIKYGGDIEKLAKEYLGV